jgi:hypothetical protein
MAVTNQKSTQLTREESYAAGRNSPIDARGEVRMLAFDFAQSGAGDATSTARLFKLPAGSVRLLEVRLVNDALGASRVLDLGYEGYANASGSAIVADPDAFAAALNVAAAATNIVAVNKTFASRDGVVVAAKVTGGTIPDAAKLTGYALYVGG